MTLQIDAVMTVLQEIFADLAEDLDLDDLELDPSTRLVDLGMESISLVYLVSELQQHYGQGDAVFRRMREAQVTLNDMTLGDIARTVVEVGDRAAV